MQAAPEDISCTAPLLVARCTLLVGALPGGSTPGPLPDASRVRGQLIDDDPLRAFLRVRLFHVVDKR